MVILTLNCGSSSAKYQVYDWDNKDVLAVGVVERIGLEYSTIEHKATGKDEYTEKLVNALQMLQGFSAGYVAADEETQAFFRELVKSFIQSYLEGVLNEWKDKINEIFGRIDIEGIRMYLWINDQVKNNEWGFDLFRTSDGENFVVITTDGFGDRYNYGCPAFLETEEGLYLGTCNPFYGGQLYLLRAEDPTDPVDDGLPCDGGDDCPGGRFTDMPAKNHWAHDPIDWAIVHGVTGGTTETTFSPKAPCTREQIVTFLWKACGAPEPASTETVFKDVKAKQYYYKAVLWAVENGITGGVGNGKFGVGTECSRAQTMTFLWAAADRPEHSRTESTFSDVRPGKYYFDAVLWAVENGITGGVGNGEFGIDRTCTRAEVVTFLYQAVNG